MIFALITENIKYILILGPLLILMIEAIMIDNEIKRINIIIRTTIISLIVILINLLYSDVNYLILNGHIGSNKLIKFLEIILIIVSIVIINIMTKELNKKVYENKSKISGETIILIFSSIIGMLISMETNNLLTLFLSIEITSICFYILALNKNNKKGSIEGALKYYIIGGITSTIILLGIYNIYSISGSLMYNDILLYLMENEINKKIIIGVSLIVLGLLIKLGVAPFHGWVIDTYEGAELLMTYFLTITQKIVTITILINLYVNIISQMNNVFDVNLLLIAVIGSLIIGILGSIRQIKLIRFIAYSGVVNSGLFILFLIGNNIEDVLVTTIFYLINYIIGLNTLILISLNFKNARTGDQVEIIEELKNMWVNNKILSIILMVVLIFLAGIPPFTSFISKIILIGPLVILDRPIAMMLVLSLTVGVMIYYVNIFIKMLIEKKETNIKIYSKIKTGQILISSGVIWLVFAQLYLDEILIVIKLIVATI